VTSAKSWLLLIAVGLVLTGLVWVKFQPSGDLSGRAPNAAAQGAIPRHEEAPSQRDLDALRRTVEEERLARLALTERVDLMQAQLEGVVPIRESSRFEGGASEVNQQGLGATPGEAGDYPADAGDLYFDPAKLKGAGIHAAEVDRLRESYDEMVMERIQLRHLSERGEIKGQELIDEKTNIRDRYRAELGDEAYDLMLYAGGEANRVSVSNVLHASPAEGVGLLPGDIILSYAGERLFTPSDLVRTTIEMDRGGTVPMVVLRGGDEHHLSIPAGPIGVAITQGKGEPYP